MAFATDDFSLIAGDINGDSLSGGGTWAHSAYADLSDGHLQASSGKVYQDTSGVDCGYYASPSPANADYDVEMDVSSASIDAFLGSSGLGVMGRVATGAATGYIAYVDRTTVYIYKIVAGSYTSLGSAAWSPSSGVTYRLKLEMRGTALKVYIDGVQKVSVTDSSITAAGKAGLYAYSLYSGSYLNSWMGDNFVATDATAINVAVGQASETDTAMSTPAVYDQTVSVGMATESDSAHRVVVPSGRRGPEGGLALLFLPAPLEGGAMLLLGVGR